MKALEDSDSSAQSTIKTKKKALRDAPAASAITNADTTTKLKAAWDEVVKEKSASDPLFAKIQASYQAFRDDYSIWAKNAYLN